ncbi:MAG: hypothetical protein U1C73_02815, partial [Dietzia sp.]|nr:hypothetical protein [Dietzia sp.]
MTSDGFMRLRLMPVARLAAAGAIAAGAVMLTAPAGNAIPESTIKSECAKANGQYHTSVLDGVRYSACCYVDYYGKKSCDFYEDGIYNITNPTLELPETTPPPPPPDGVVGPPATVATQPPPPMPDYGLTMWMPPPAGPEG